MEAKIDPHKVLDLPKNYTLDMLRDSYKRMALKAHPDKGGSEYLFKLVTQCYKYLVAELKKREADKQFYELKKDFMSQTGVKQSSTQKDKSKKTLANNDEENLNTIQQLFYKGSRFDQAKFNKFFNDNKMKDEVNEAGYKEWMEKQQVSEAPQFRGSFTNDCFNSHFEKNVQVNRDNRQIIKYKEPDALVTVKRLGFTELGQDNVDDFSGENKSLRHLNYMDYRVAHTTSRIVDPSYVRRQNFKNVDELEKSRENISYQMTEKELVEYMKRQKLQEKLEEQRKMALRNYDQRVQQHYQKINGLLR